MDAAAALLADQYALNVHEVGDEITALRAHERNQLYASLVILFLGCVLGGVLSRRVYRSVTAPLKALEDATAHLGRDDLSHRVEVHGNDELARVGSAFNAMADKLQLSREELQHQALHDPLTGLPNRALFMEHLEHALARARRKATPVSVLYLDLDGFKTVNDTLGHEAGDEVLVDVAERLRQALREADMVARLGGDEFGIVLEEELQGATVTAQRIVRQFERPWSLSSGYMSVSVSIGVAARADDEGLDELLRQADTAMYAAKASGKGRWRVFSPDLAPGQLTTRSFRAELQHAVEAEEFVVHYQPVMDLASGFITGVEALVRWNHPERGLLAPDQFLGEAEVSGHVVQIDRLVLREACRQVRAWQRSVPGAEHLSVHVNLSARGLQTPDLADEIGEAVRVSGLAPSDLVLEITETTLVHDADAAAIELRKLKDLHVELALDDFGTGFSSLTHLTSSRSTSSRSIARSSPPLGSTRDVPNWSRRSWNWGRPSVSWSWRKASSRRPNWTTCARSAASGLRATTSRSRCLRSDGEVPPDGPLESRRRRRRPGARRLALISGSPISFGASVRRRPVSGSRSR